MIIDPFWCHEGVMFNQYTPLENIFFITFKDVMAIKN